MLGLIISIVVIGLIAGALARLVVPGRQDISILMTIVLGVVGSFVGGFLGYVIFHKDAQDGFVQARGDRWCLHRCGHRPVGLDSCRPAPLGWPLIHHFTDAGRRDHGQP